MKPLLFLTLALLFAACSPQNQDNNNVSPVPKEKTENSSLKTADVSFASSRSNDVIQAIYSQLLKNNPALQNIESAMGSIGGDLGDSTEAFKVYNNNNNAYYDAAHNYLSQIKDTVLRSRLQQLVEKSMNAYTNKTAIHSALLKDVDSVTTILHDAHTALKIVVTLPVIENYQNVNLPSAEPVKGVITKANNLVKQINAVEN